MPAEFTHADRQVGIRKTVTIIVIFMVLVVGLFINKINHPRVLSPKEMVANGTIVFSLPREISPFSLVDQNKETFTQDKLLNKWTLVFFGFTHCPDICPTTLALFNEVARSLQETPWENDTQFLLVSLDPARDTPEKLKVYLEYFNTDFIGVTGEFLTIHRLAKQLNTAFQKVVTNSETGDYTVDHGGNVAIINPQGHYQGFFKPPLDASRMSLTYQSLRSEKQ